MTLTSPPKAPTRTLYVCLVLFVLGLAACGDPIVPSLNANNAPTPPATIAEAVVSPDSVTLSWAPVANASLYRVYQLDANATAAQVQPAAVAETEVCQTSDLICTSSGLQNNTRYTYRIKAYAANQAVVGEYQRQITTLPAATSSPASVTGFSYKALGATHLTLVWDPIPNASWYQLSGGNLTATDQIKATRKEDSGLTANRSYTYQIKACNTAGCSVNTSFTVNTASAATPPVIAPSSAPTHFVSGAVSATSATLTWSAVSGASWYVLSGGKLSATTQITALTVTDSGLTASTGYTYTVQACNSAGCGATASVNVTTSAPPVIAPASAPTHFVSSAVSATSATLTWSAVSGASWYHLTGGNLNIDTKISTTTVSDSGLAASTGYTYTVKACNSAGCGPTAKVSVSTTAPPVVLPNSAPTNFVSSAVSATSVTLTWSAVSGASWYVLSGGRLTSTTQITALTVTDNDLSASTPYTYTLKACNSAGCGPSASTNVATTAPPVVAPSSAPTNFASSALTSSGVTLSWTAVSGASWYLLTGGNLNTSTQIAATSVTDSGLSASTPYTYTVKACNSAGCGPTANATVTTAAPPIPAVPTLTASTILNQSVSLTWSAIPNATYYLLARNGVDLPVPGSSPATTQITTTSFTDTGLTVGTAYSYTLKACNAQCSAPSTALSISTYPLNPFTLRTLGLDTKLPGATITAYFQLAEPRAEFPGTRSALLSSPSFKTSVGLLYGEKLTVWIKTQPSNGQTCTSLSDPAGMPVVIGDNYADFDCQTALKLSYASPAASIPLATSGVTGAPQLPSARYLSGNAFAGVLTGISYTSSDPTVATVDSNGQLTTLKQGTTTITASLDTAAYTTGTGRGSASTGATGSYTLTVTAPIAFHLHQTEFAQSIAQTTSNSYQVLAPNRKVLVRTYVGATSASNTTPPTVTMTASFNGVSQTKTMTCPAQLLVGSAAAATSYSLTGTCYTQIDNLAIVRRGMSVTISASAGGQSSAYVLNPRVNTRATASIKFIPITLTRKASAQTGVLPTDAAIASYLSHFPLASFAVTKEATPFAPGIPAETTDASTLFKDVLRALQSKQTTEGLASTHYAGIMPFGSSGPAYGTTGLAYTPGTTMVGINDEQTLVHEIGHNFSLYHAPCGGAGSPDPFYSTAPLPWPNSDKAVLPATPIYDQITDGISNPLSSYTKLGSEPSGYPADVMAYCAGHYFSEYAYKKMADYIESKSTLYGPPSALLTAANVSSSRAISSQAILVQGRISPEGVVYLSPFLTFTRTWVEPSEGNYQLSLYSSNGSVVSTQFEAVPMDHDDSKSRYFTVVLPWIPDITRVAVVQEGFRELAIAPLARSTTLARIASVTNNKIYVTPEITEANQKVTVHWDAVRNPWLSLTYIAPNGARNTLIVNAAGGLATASTQGLPAGGQWEIARSNGLNSILETRQR